MSECAPDTAYYINPKLCRVAYVAKDVRFPRGRWVRLVTGEAQPWFVEQLVDDLFPALRGCANNIAMLMTDFDVDEFEHGISPDATTAQPS